MDETSARVFLKVLVNLATEYRNAVDQIEFDRTTRVVVAEEKLERVLRKLRTPTPCP